MTIHDMLLMLVQQEGSDIHIMPGVQPTLRVHGRLTPISQTPVLTPEQVETLVTPLMNQDQLEYVRLHKELDFGYQFGDKGRFRVNVYHSMGSLAASLRLVPPKIKTIEELQLPEILHQFSEYKQGLVLVTGPTGEGKSTTLAAIIEEINQKRSEHILTIEDPIEFVYKPQLSIISQREINHDTMGWDVALKSSLREDPNVVLVGEMRDYETIAAAITVAETGHLVFATLHTSSASQTIDRIIDVFPSHQQDQVRQQLASSIKAVVSQRLIPLSEGGRIAAIELMIANPAIRNLIREGKTYQLDNVIQTGASEGMMLIETSLVQIVQRGQISEQQGRLYAIRPDEFDRLLHGR